MRLLDEAVDSVCLSMFKGQPKRRANDNVDEAFDRVRAFDVMTVYAVCAELRDEEQCGL